jgi:glycine betaine transporter
VAVTPAPVPTEPSGAEPPDDRGVLGAVFWIPIAIAAAFVAAGVLATEAFNEALTTVVGEIITNLGWLLLLIVAGFLAFVVFLALSRFGTVRLGGPDARPEFSTFSWFSMLFQAGMGIGLVFWAVSEPLLHFRTPPLGQAEPLSGAAADLALVYAFFHWTLHPWAIYAVVGLAVAYFGARGLRISAVLRPLLGDRVDGPVGQAVDVLAVVATLFGIATSLASGALQIDAGLGEAFGLPRGIGTELAIIAVTAVAYLLSASTPIDRGVRLLSNASIVLAVVLAGFVFLAGPTILQLNAFTQGIGQYAGGLLPRSLQTSAFDPDPWLGEWTIFFWSTWIAWAPYVGVFIARISRGRTIRQFVLGVLLAPSLFTMIWFAVFGAAGIDADTASGGQLSRAASEDEAAALFQFLDGYAVPLVTSALAIFLVWIFFVAGADAGTIVLGSMSTGGDEDPPRRLRLAWGVVLAAVAGAILVAGGLDALQGAAIVAATPFALLMVAICWCLYRALARDHPAVSRGEAS